MRYKRVISVVALVCLGLIGTRSVHPNLQLEIEGAGTFGVVVSESTFTVYNNRPSIIDLDLNNDFVFNSADLGLLLGDYNTRFTSVDLGQLLGVLGAAWHRQDLEGAPDFGWYYVVPGVLKPVISYDSDGLTTYLSWGETHKFRTVREEGNLKEGLQITLESQERRTYYIKMRSQSGL
ncbi:MAG: hypothetical protein ACF8GE_03485 [Phycisphaerales bacterium JB043]